MSSRQLSTDDGRQHARRHLALCLYLAEILRQGGKAALRPARMRMSSRRTQTLRRIRRTRKPHAVHDSTQSLFNKCRDTEKTKGHRTTSCNLSWLE